MRPRGWLVYNVVDAQRNEDYISWMLDEALAAGLALELVIREDITIGIRGSRLIVDHRGKAVEPPHFAIVRTADYTFRVQLETLGVRCFNSAEVCRICNNKAITHQYFARFAIPMADTVFAHTGNVQADSIGLPFPVVVKEVGGRGGHQVFRADSRIALQELLETVPSGEIVIQALTDAPGRDLRVFVVGNRIISAVLRFSATDFRANYSLGGQSRLYQLTDAQVRLVASILDHIRLDFGGIDFVFNSKGELLFNEIEDVVGSRTLSLNSDINIVQVYMQHIARELSGHLRRTSTDVTL